MQQELFQAWVVFNDSPMLHLNFCKKAAAGNWTPVSRVVQNWHHSLDGVDILLVVYVYCYCLQLQNFHHHPPVNVAGLKMRRSCFFDHQDTSLIQSLMDIVDHLPHLVLHCLVWLYCCCCCCSLSRGLYRRLILFLQIFIVDDKPLSLLSLPQRFSFPPLRMRVTTNCLRPPLLLFTVVIRVSSF